MAVPKQDALQTECKCKKAGLTCTDLCKCSESYLDYACENSNTAEDLEDEDDDLSCSEDDDLNSSEDEDNNIW